MATPYINAYHNDPTVENLFKLMIHTFSCDFIILSWYISSGYWFIPAMIDLKMSTLIQTNDASGWYLQEELSVRNIPARHSRMVQHAEIKSKYSKIIYRVEQSVIQPANEIINFAVCAFLDKLASEDLIRRQRFRQELMMSNISHSIRTPLNGILHMTRAVVESKGAPGQILDESINYLNQSTVALATNIFDIIDMTKLELGKLTLNKEIFNIRMLISSTMDLANTLNKSKNISLNSHVDASVPEYIYSDSKRVKQILINLLENALQHTQTGEIFIYATATVINLAAEDIDRGMSLAQNAESSEYQFWISFSVRDTGLGIDAKTKDNLFKPMELLTNAKQQGLSLRISYLLAKLLNGDLKLITSEPNRGSCFEFSLITCEEEPPRILSNTLRGLKDKKILLLDDTNDHVSLCKVLERYQTKYILATSYEEVSILHLGKAWDLIIVKSKTTSLARSVKSHVPMLFISESHDNIPDYYMDLDYDESIFKTKLLSIFNRVEPDNHQLRILVVEDEQINRIVIEKLLRSLKYKNITICNNGEEALKIYKAELFDVLLIDIRMPLMSGFELADKIYAINPRVKMIGVTAQMIIEKDVKPWFSEFIYKPIDTHDLQKKLSEIS